MWIRSQTLNAWTASKSGLFQYSDTWNMDCFDVWTLKIRTFLGLEIEFALISGVRKPGYVPLYLVIQLMFDWNVERKNIRSFSHPCPSQSGGQLYQQTFASFDHNWINYHSRLINCFSCSWCWRNYTLFARSLSGQVCWWNWPLNDIKNWHIKTKQEHHFYFFVTVVIFN